MPQEGGALAIDDEAAGRAIEKGEARLPLDGSDSPAHPGLGQGKTIGRFRHAGAIDDREKRLQTL